jgi:hypothetical protein
VSRRSLAKKETSNAESGECEWHLGFWTEQHRTVGSSVDAHTKDEPRPPESGKTLPKERQGRILVAPAPPFVSLVSLDHKIHARLWTLFAIYSLI